MATEIVVHVTEQDADPLRLDDLGRALRDELLEVDKVTSPRDAFGGGSILKHATNYLQQMLVAAAFTLLKLMRSFFCKTIDFDRGRSLFHHAIRAIRATSEASAPGSRASGSGPSAARSSDRRMRACIDGIVRVSRCLGSIP